MEYEPALRDLTDNLNLERLTEVQSNKYFLEECKLILTEKRSIKYYKYIINNIAIDKINPNNSYIMWICNKVDNIDKDKPVKRTESHISLPDVDMDFEAGFRDNIIQYMKNRFGHDKVAQISTFSRMQGRSALKDVLHAHNVCSFEEMNRITEYIPDEAEIADQLQEMREDNDGEASIIRWALENNSDELREWCYIKEDGSLDGPLAKKFEQAIRLEGTKRSQGKHASGIVISDEKLSDVCPMIYDQKTGEQICGLEMNGLEALGIVKFDILGVSLLDRLHGVLDLVNE